MDTAIKFEFRGRRYRANVDSAGRVKEAWVLVQPHDKMPSWRYMRSPVTLRILNDYLNPAKTCPACGQPITKEQP
jgi:hypothetical protein